MREINYGRFISVYQSQSKVEDMYYNYNNQQLVVIVMSVVELGIIPRPLLVLFVKPRRFRKMTRHMTAPAYT